MKRFPRNPLLFHIGLICILIGYLSVWLPLEPAGLRQAGFELGEWIKFIPQVQEGSTPDRNFLYLPPLILSTLLIMMTIRWPARWQTWAMRGVAGLIALIALPALQIILDEPSAEWRLRVALISGIFLFAAAAPLLKGVPITVWVGAAALLSLLGAIVPTMTYLGMRSHIAYWVQLHVTTGYGVWLAMAGHLCVLLALFLSYPLNAKKPAAT